jgi:hypothetical protein
MENKLGHEQGHIQELHRELEIRMEEAQKQTTDLQKELEKVERREIYFEEMHNNYMMQVQTLINQKTDSFTWSKKAMVAALLKQKDEKGMKEVVLVVN